MTDAPYRSLRRAEAVARADLLSVEAYDVTLDLAADDTTYPSRTVIAFTSRGGETFLDLRPDRVREIRLDGQPLDADRLDHGRLPLAIGPGRHELVVDAVMRFRNDGEGMHRSVDPADGRHYVYGMCFMEAAPSIFACFDQPDLKAPFTMHVRAPEDWTVIGNAPGSNPEPGVWEFETTRPLATYFVTLVAGPWHVIADEHDGIPLGLSCRASLAADLDKDAAELLTGTKRSFDEFHRLFGIRYPFGGYHQAFVPEFNAGAMENPGCVTFRDPLVFTSRVPRALRVARMTTVAHELAHQWFGNLTTPRWWDDLWLNESFAEYMGNRVTAEVTEFTDAWTYDAHSRRPWGLVADQRPSTHPVAGNEAADAATALQDFDGISYAKGSSILRQLNARIGDEVFFRGTVDHFERARFGNASMGDLVACWERAGAGDLSDFVGGWLRTAGPDTLAYDRSVGAVRRLTPAAHPAHREHAVRIATAAPGGTWQVSPLLVRAAETPVSVEAGHAIVVDPFEDSWALVPPDEDTVRLLPDLLPRTDDARMRAGIWNGLRSAFHDARVAPERALAVLERAVPAEADEIALETVLRWAVRTVAPLATDPDTALRRVHETALAAARAARPGSTLQLAAVQGAVASSATVEHLRGWLAEPPDGVDLDLDLRWRILVRLAVLGGVDREELAAALAAEPTAVSQVEHTKALAALPDEEAKAFAWRHFTGETDAANYDLEAAGIGLWQVGQEELTAPYAARYFAELPATAETRTGWVLAEAADWFFPLTSLTEDTLRRARALIERPDLERSLRRTVVDRADELARRLAVVTAFGGHEQAFGGHEQAFGGHEQAFGGGEPAVGGR